MFAMVVFTAYNISRKRICHVARLRPHERILFGVVGFAGMLLGIFCLVLEIQITLSLRNALTDKAAVRRRRKKKRRRTAGEEEEIG